MPGSAFRKGSGTGAGYNAVEACTEEFGMEREVCSGDFNRADRVGMRVDALPERFPDSAVDERT